MLMDIVVLYNIVINIRSIMSNFDKKVICFNGSSIEVLLSA